MVWFLWSKNPPKSLKKKKTHRKPDAMLMHTTLGSRHTAHPGFTERAPQTPPLTPTPRRAPHLTSPPRRRRCCSSHFSSWCPPTAKPRDATLGPHLYPSTAAAAAEMAAPTTLRSAAARARARAAELVGGGRWPQRRLGTTSAAETESRKDKEEVEGAGAGWELSAAREYYDYRKSIYGDVTHRALLVDAVGTLVVPAQPTAQVSTVARRTSFPSPTRPVPLRSLLPARCVPALVDVLLRA